MSLPAHYAVTEGVIAGAYPETPEGVRALERSGVTVFVDLTHPSDPLESYERLLDGTRRIAHPIPDMGTPDRRARDPDSRRHRCRAGGRRDRVRPLLGRRRAERERWWDASSSGTGSTQATRSRASPSCAATSRGRARHRRRRARPRSSAAGGRAGEAPLAPPAPEVELGRARARRSRPTAGAARPQGGQAHAAMGGRPRRPARPRAVLDRRARPRDAGSRRSRAGSTRRSRSRAGSTTPGPTISLDAAAERRPASSRACC